MIFDQSEYDIRCEWGEEGVRRLLPLSDVVIVVDVLSFSTSIEIATNQGARVFPYRWKDESVYDYAHSRGAMVADRNSESGFHLSPSSLLKLPKKARLVLPSPNGAALSLLAQDARVIAGCFRNSRAVAEYAISKGRRIAVIPAGERWPDDSLRPCVEDLVGAGAIIRHLPGKLSPEALMAVAAFEKLEANLLEHIKGCVSGREKLERGEESDLHLTCALDVSSCVPVLKEGAFRKEG
jgi:2-phosphosulfolactate phosphatase